MVGMSESPTTHYARPFHLAGFDKKLMSLNSFCQNGRNNFNLNMDYASDFMRVYGKSGFFSLTFLNQYSHDTNKELSWLDADLLKFLRQFNADETMRANTILILFSDHGARFSELRKSIKGLLHERNPFFSIYMPTLFKERYPHEYNNIKNNFNKVVAPMDIHATFMDLIRLESGGKAVQTNSRTRHTSLFATISPERNCADAGIDPHWCACLKRTKLNVTSYHYLKDIASLFMDFLNTNLLGDQSNLCSKLVLKHINKVYLLDSFIDSKKKKKAESVGFFKLHRLLEEPDIQVEFKKYLFQITTSPNEAIYEFTVTYESQLQDSSHAIDLSKVKIDQSLISRINSYGNSSHCIFNKFPDLRKYCYCK